MIAATVTFFGVGRLPWAPGTWGSMAAIPLAYGLHWGGGFWAVFAVTLVAIFGGVWATKFYLAGQQDDPSEVVIDEVAGMMVALWPLSFMLNFRDVDPHIFPWPGWVGGFVLFRLLDILKPPPIRWLDRPTPWGVMLDDIAAGAITGLIMFVAAGVSHGWF
ncbi:MAG: phosphatidylglycerophosphatase A [Pseudomonadota bacterium]